MELLIAFFNAFKSIEWVLVTRIAVFFIFLTIPIGFYLSLKRQKKTNEYMELLTKQGARKIELEEQRQHNSRIEEELKFSNNLVTKCRNEHPPFKRGIDWLSQ